jgi:hypothetical protein
VLLAVFIVVMIWLLPKLVRGVRMLFRTLRGEDGSAST